MLLIVVTNLTAAWWAENKLLPEPGSPLSQRKENMQEQEP